MQTKEQVLMLLLRAEGALSGEQIGEILGVSRTAVNMAVHALREDGYAIFSATRRGYILENTPDLLSCGQIAAFLSGGNTDSEEAMRNAENRMAQVCCLREVDSTNRLLSQMAQEGAQTGQVVISNHQSAGRGRRGREFHSPAGSGIYLSYLIRPREKKTGEKRMGWTEGLKARTMETGTPETGIKDWTMLTSWTAVVVAKAIEEACGISPGIKWVNDLGFFLGDGNWKKACGILTQMDLETESGSVRGVVIGIGINVRQKKKDFPKDLRETACSLAMAGGRNVLRAQLTAEIIRGMDTMVTDWPKEKEAYLQEYRRRSVMPGKEIIVHNGEKDRGAKALFIEDDFSLRVRYSNNTTENLTGGEVSIRIRNNRNTGK